MQYNEVSNKSELNNTINRYNKYKLSKLNDTPMLKKSPKSKVSKELFKGKYIIMQLLRIEY